MAALGVAGAGGIGLCPDKIADAVIAVDLDYQELSAANKGGMLMIVASGTAVKLMAES